MKRIEFIAPVEAMRGNLSGTQTGLEYPAADNKAYESPVGSTNYARNYRPSFIGAKRAKDGLKYFSVKTKSAIHLTAKSKRQMALLGGAGAIIAAILRDKSSQAYIGVSLAFTYQKIEGMTDAKSLREWLTAKLVKGLSRKMAVILNTRTSATSTIKINNPWVEGGDGVDVQVTNESLARFWMELANNPIEFDVEGAGKAVAHVGDTFAQIIAGGYNVLGMTAVDGNVKIGSGFVQHADASDPSADPEWYYVQPTDTAYASSLSNLYRIVDDEPEP